MSYRRALLTRWSRRDRLAVLVVGVTVAFLVGTTLLVFAAGAQTATIAAQFDSPGSVTAHDTPAAARASDPDAVVLPLERDAGGTAVGIPANASVGGVALRDAVPKNWTVREPGTVSPDAALAVHPAPETAVSGETGGEADSGNGSSATVPSGAVPSTGVPLLSALAFFVAGTTQALVVVGVAAGCGGLLVGVTVFSVTRMSVRDRLSTIRVVRSTGGRPRTVMGLFAARAALLTGVGVALGYAVGVIATNLAVNLAVTTGLPTSLAVRVSPRAVRVLVPLFAGLVAVGLGSGIAASWRAARIAPGRLVESVAERVSGGERAGGLFGSVREAIRPSLLGWRPLVPTAATLTAFVLFAALAVGLAGVAAPLSGGTGPVGGLAGDAGPETTTIVEPGSTHPVSSSLPAGYADALRARGAAASPEILLFEAVDGAAVPARGANYTAFARVTGAELTEGRAPRDEREAVLGRDMAATLDLAVGDRLLLGGSTRAAVTRVRVVGTFRAPGPFDDQVVVPLSTARELSTVRGDRVNLVRATGVPEADGTDGSGIGVTDLAAPRRVAANGQFDVSVTLRNDGPTRRTGTIPVTYRGETRTVEADLQPFRSTRRVVTFPAGEPGGYVVQAGGANTSVTVRPRDAVSLDNVPTRAPPGSEPLVHVVNASGAPTSATVTVTNATWNRSVRAGGDGRVRLPLPETAGSYTVRAVTENGSVNASLVVTSDAERTLDASLAIRPGSPSTLVRPTARLSLSNQWREPLTRDLRLTGPGTTLDREVTVGPGESTRLSADLARRAPGSYPVRVTFAAESRELNTTYRVTGDDRIVAALATSGRTGSSGIGQAIEVAFGNLGLLVGTLVVLAALMTVGGTTAAFAAAVAARRRTLGVYRATGATPARVARLVLADALRIGMVAAVVAVVLASVALLGLGAVDLLVVFGVRLGFPSLPVLVACAVGAVLLTLVAAGLALVEPLRVPPRSLLDDEMSAPQGSERSEARRQGTKSATPARGDDDD